MQLIHSLRCPLLPAAPLPPAVPAANASVHVRKEGDAKSVENTNTMVVQQQGFRFGKKDENTKVFITVILVYCFNPLSKQSFEFDKYWMVRQIFEILVLVFLWLLYISEYSWIE